MLLSQQINIMHKCNSFAFTYFWAAKMHKTMINHSFVFFFSEWKDPPQHKDMTEKEEAK